MPVESTMRTRRLLSVARKVGKARKGLYAMFSSSRLTQPDSEGGKALRKFAEMSSASRQELIWGRAVARNVGTWFGVDEDPINRCVVSAALTRAVKIGVHAGAQEKGRT